MTKLFVNIFWKIHQKLLKKEQYFFSIKYQYIYISLKSIWTTRKKTFLYEERDEKKRSEFSYKENIIFYFDKSGIKNTLRNDMHGLSVENWLMMKESSFRQKI